MSNSKVPTVPKELEMGISPNIDVDQENINDIMTKACKEFNYYHRGIRGEISPCFMVQQHAYFLTSPARYATIDPKSDGITVNDLIWDATAKLLIMKYVPSDTILDITAKYGIGGVVYKPRAVVKTIGRNAISGYRIITVDAYLSEYADKYAREMLKR